MNKMELLGKNIALQRKKKGLTQVKLAGLLNISREHLAKVEIGVKGLSIDLLFRVCEALNIKEKVLFNFERK